MITKPYNSYSTYIKQKFGKRVQKVSLDTGFTCPNRDGTKGIGGCTYCNNNTFNPYYCKPKKSITQQLNDGIAFFAKKYKTQEYLAYFQAYSNTYADIELVKSLYLEALNHPKIVGLVIGTRPDCINEDLIQFLSDLAKRNYISLEFGVESTLNKTLDFINRCHSFEETIAAYELSKNKGIELGAHVIIGLPGETREEMLHHANELSKLPINTLKIHQLQIVKHTMMARQYETNPEFFQLFSLNEYIQFMGKFVSKLRPDITIERFTSESPAHLLVAPKWNGIKNFEITSKIEKYLLENNFWQGKNF
ncbi:MAG: TIGR01212 family radical SAM protein [Flavobacteriales bacterium]|nr:TIGR01212 family radical SAM protein [Flavobacteriales bacterium]MCW8911866.1 TIGR01212 family radical SAM protein [Flavobacteriales bacterium]MCW8936363.1 TIGR01212 family radical SAM protein [Flavobacteriales bacterium]MCW8939667.1 TIGR01212 family radical SAM protein [Flavobacteriales bacterium]MCW8966965.1 TIGR01212 family radical SAM protein [Flavobacteriales bacterium]